jgi:glutamine---fructose-6-phosphate transaminase (isomerizing)
MRNTDQPTASISNATNTSALSASSMNPVSTLPSLMLQESREAPAAVAAHIDANRETYQAFGKALRATPPQSILTLARGSSDHAAHYMAYLMMARTGQLVTSLPMSLITLYQSQIRATGLLSTAFSQSGQSPDLVAPTRYFREQNALTAAFVNDPQSPLAAASEWVFPLHAGAEKSVAATKSFITQLVAGASLVAAWQQDESVQRAIDALPEALVRAASADWSIGVDILKNAEKMFVIGRGMGQAVALEAALKFKETCVIQAEAFSGAEVKHGPMALIDAGYAVLVFAPRGPAQAGLLQFADEMRARGAKVLLAAPAGTPGANLPLVETGSADLDPIAVVQSFYPMVEAISRARGFDPDKPKFLAKVTKTH